MIGKLHDDAKLMRHDLMWGRDISDEDQWNEMEFADDFVSDVQQTDCAIESIRMILLTTKATLENIDRKNVETRNSVLESALSSIYNILLTPEGKPK